MKIRIKIRQPLTNPALATLFLIVALLPGTAVYGATKVTPDTFIRAESDRMFSDIAKQASGVNKLFHFRHITPLDRQTVIRMNKDTLYSMGIVDTHKGATITFPEIPDGRYASIYLVDNDHYVPAVFYKPGIYKLPRDTKYLGIGVRIQLFNPDDPEEIKLINQLQDQFVIKANSADPFPAFKWDKASLKALHAQYEKEATGYSNWNGTQGPRGKVNEKTRHIAAAAVWGLFPEKDATYLNYSGEHDTGSCWQASYPAPENKAFWSITVYGKDGFLKHENSIVNSSNVKLNNDGTFTVYYGSRALCGKVANRLDVTPGWNFLMRIYRPGESVLDGSYKLPEAQRYVRDMIENYIREFPNQEQAEMMNAWLKEHDKGTFWFTGLVDPDDDTVITPQATVDYGYNWFSLSDGPAIVNTPQYDKFFSVSVFDMKHNVPAVIVNPGKPIVLMRPGQEKPSGDFHVVELETDQGLVFTRMVVVDNLQEVEGLRQYFSMEGGKGDMHREVYKFSPAIKKSALAMISHSLSYVNPDVAFGEKSGDAGELSLAAGVMLGQLGTPADTVRYGLILADEHGKPFNDKDTYVLTVPAGIVHDNGYFSVTLYGSDNKLLIPNDRKVYDSTTYTAEKNSDGTYTVTLSPSGEGENGIPTGGKVFYGILRAYVPVKGADMTVRVKTKK